MQIEQTQNTSEASATPATGRVKLILDDGGIALICLGDPSERVVTLTHERMLSLKEVLLQLGSSKPQAVIITGSGPEMFTAGADISLIRDITDAHKGELLSREGQEIFSLIEKLPCPTLAAISGVCVGGGCELALACTYRIITDHKSSLIGLPEVKLGIIPGFGGTQRLPRLVGLPKALDIILAGKTLRPKQALNAGLVDAIVPLEQLKSAAEEYVTGRKKINRKKLSFFDSLATHFSFVRNFVKSKAEASVQKETKGFYPAPPAALTAVALGLEQGSDVGYKYEAKELGRVACTPECKSLVRLFFLTESAKALGKPAKKNLEQFHAVVVGAGVMGAGIAGVLARHDCNVILRDTSDESLARGLQQIKSFVGKLTYLSDSERSFILNRIEVTTKDTTNLGNATCAIEAIFEQLDVKQRVLNELALLLPQDAIIATNTSSLSVTQIASGIPNPERVIGMHFFNPVEKMPLVEIIRGAKTGNRAIAIIAALATKLGKFPIVVEDVPGFLVNRILAPYISEAAHLLNDGYSISDIDAAALGFGLPMGPFRLLDEVGLDVAAHVAEVLTRGYGERVQGPRFVDTLLAQGRKGKKSGAGFYDFSKPNPVPFADILQTLGLTRPALPSKDSSIIDRLIMRLINEGVRCLDEGVAGVPGPEAAAQIDLGTVMGIGFPPFRGGLLHYAEALTASKILSTLKDLEQKHGSRFTPWQGIVARAEKNSSFTVKIV